MIRRTRSILAAAAAVTALSLTACGGGSAEKSSSSPAAPSTASASASATAAQSSGTSAGGGQSSASAASGQGGAPSADTSGLDANAKVMLGTTDTQAKAIADSAGKMYPYLINSPGQEVMPRKNAEVYTSFVKGLELGTYKVEGKKLNQQTLTICVQTEAPPLVSTTYEVKLLEEKKSEVKRTAQKADGGC